jgi:hypothetical protein
MRINRRQLALLALALVAPVGSVAAADAVGTKAPVAALRRPLRVLLYAGSTTRDYQFCRALFTSLAKSPWAEVSVCVQGRDAKVMRYDDIPAERVLSQFPTVLRTVADPKEKPADRYANLAHYDVVITFDPDWTKLAAEQANLLEKWVTAGGGLIMLAGPVNTHQLARKENQAKFKAILSVCPVVPGDHRMDAPKDGDAVPRRLHFTAASAAVDFLRLDEQADAPLAGWEQFFTGPPGTPDQKDRPLRRGFYSYHPVKSIKPAAIVVAAFGDPKARMDNGQEQPWLVTMAFSRGKVVWLGSGETWRLRPPRTAFFQRFWINLCLFAAGDALIRRDKEAEPRGLKVGEDLWASLASEDLTEAYPTLWSLAAAPMDAAPFLDQRLRAVPMDDVHERIARFVGQLDSKRFDERRRAAEGLEKLGRVAMPALRRLLDSKPSLEVRQRAERLLEMMEKLPAILDDSLRCRRAIVALESIGTPQARQTLEALAKGPPRFWLTLQAKAALDRLTKNAK